MCCDCPESGDVRFLGIEETANSQQPIPHDASTSVLDSWHNMGREVIWRIGTIRTELQWDVRCVGHVKMVDCEVFWARSPVTEAGRGAIPILSCYLVKIS